MNSALSLHFSAGKHIFNPADHPLEWADAGFAQSPQLLQTGDHLRVYYSTRQRDQGGKFRSQVAFADFDADFGQVLRQSQQPVISTGALGTFDEHGIFPFHVLRRGSQTLAYTTGWTRRVSVSVDAAIGLAISDDDGLTFQRYSDGPVLAPSTHEPFLVGDAFVIETQGLLHMWYIHGVRWIHTPSSSVAERVYKIAHATSEDGIQWHREGRQIVPDGIGVDECQALPTVLKINDCYRMIFCYRHAADFRSNSSKGYRLGYAYSYDLENWTRADELLTLPLSSSGWDADMQCYPHLCQVGNDVYLLYNGNEFGRYGFGVAKLES